MDIRRETLGYASYTDRGPTRPGGEIIETYRVAIPQRQDLSDRRRRPDRRRQRLAFAGPDRRSRPDRRQPKLLSSRGPRPEPLEDRRGRFVDEVV